MSLYPTGAILEVELTPCARNGNARPAAQEDIAQPQTLRLEVVRPIEPFTMSVVLCVKTAPVEDPDDLADTETNSTPVASSLESSKTYILKLFDRRCGNGLRSGGYEHSAELEAEYQQWLARPDRTSISYKRWTPYWKRDGFPKEEDVAVVEDWIQHCCNRSYRNEVAIYERLTQDATKAGLFPRFFGRVILRTDIGVVQGFVAEYVEPAITLTQLLTDAGPCDRLGAMVQEVRSNALQTLARLNDAYILNEDVRTDNVLVRLSKPWPARGVYPEDVRVLGCVFIDFGHARLRHTDETDFEWFRAKQYESEDSALHSSMNIIVHDARWGVCLYHADSCRKNKKAEAAPRKALEIGKKTPIDQLRPDIVDRFALDLSPEQVRIAEVYPLYGHYEHRPHPLSVEEALTRRGADHGLLDGR